MNYQISVRLNNYHHENNDIKSAPSQTNVHVIQLRHESLPGVLTVVTLAGCCGCGGGGGGGEALSWVTEVNDPYTATVMVEYQPFSISPSVATFR